MQRHRTIKKATKTVPGCASMMMRTIEFVYYLFCVGLLIAGLHHGDVRPSGEWFVLVIWPILIAVSVWFFGSYLQRGRGGLI
jgi:hypothetical protein